MGRLRERVAVITGGGSGIGRATAVRFAEEGAVSVVVDIDAKGAAATVDLIEKDGGTACWFECDVTDAKAADSVTKSVIERYGSVDVLVTAAATSVGKKIPDTLVDFHTGADPPNSAPCTSKMVEGAEMVVPAPSSGKAASSSSANK